MKLFDAVMDLARENQGLETYIITAVGADGKRFRCEDLAGHLGEYSHGGTCFFISGNAAGIFVGIEANSADDIRLSKRVEGFAVGDRIALSARRYFDTQTLVSAINSVLYSYPIMKIAEGDFEESEEMAWSFFGNEMRFPIPEEVTQDIRRIEFQSSFPWRQKSFTVSHYWRIIGTDIAVMSHAQYKPWGKYRIYYVDNHGEVYEPNAELDPIVDRVYLKRMAGLYLWTHEIQATHKDDVIAIDMFNQAKQYESELRKKNVPELNLLKKDMTYFW